VPHPTTLPCQRKAERNILMGICNASGRVTGKLSRESGTESPILRAPGPRLGSVMGRLKYLPHETAQFLLTIPVNQLNQNISWTSYIIKTVTVHVVFNNNE
jgi:hypothetical protein